MNTLAATSNSPAINLEALPRADDLPIQANATQTFRIARVVISVIARSLFRIRVTGRENIPDGPFVLIANHLNWVDSVAITLSVPSEPRLHFLGEVKHIIVHPRQWKLVCAMGGFIPVANGRRDATLFSHIDRCLEQGAAVALYPEGCYGDTEGELGEFKRGFAHFAINNNVPVLPVGLRGNKNLWFRKRLQVTIGAPLDPSGLDVDAMVSVGHNAVKQLLTPYREPRGPKLFRDRLTNLFYSGHKSS
jgi:1-acyl-sn-glycerol-3-phosphate acyltransferase